MDDKKNKIEKEIIIEEYKLGKEYYNEILETAKENNQNYK